MAESKKPPEREWYYLIWWDAGTGRMRVSFNADQDSLLRRAASSAMADSRPELYRGLGERVALRMPDPKPPKAPKAKAKKKRAAKKHVPAEPTPALAA